MATYIDYIDDKSAHDNAVSDCKTWLVEGSKAWQAAQNIALNGTYDQFVLGMAFAGITGFPVKELYKHFVLG